MFKCIRNKAAQFAVAVVGLLAASTPVHAGIPVIDGANLAQAISQVSSAIMQIENQVQQITQLDAQIRSMTEELDAIRGLRELGSFGHDLGLDNYIPPNVQTVINSVATDGYAGLSASARILRDANMVYNCLDLADSERRRCQARLAQPYQHKAVMQDALAKAAGRLAQIQGLMNRVDAAPDPKSVQELQARIGSENAMLTHELSQLQAAHFLAQAERETMASQVMEARLENLKRTYRAVDDLAPFTLD